MIIFSLSQQDELTHYLADHLAIPIVQFEMREFPDTETYLRIKTTVVNKTVLLIYRLDRPNNKVLSLMFIAKTLKAQGAKKICLIAPYLPYMRQDQQFQPGEAVTSVLFAQFITTCIDELITIDPHLHRIKKLAAIYPIPAITLHANALIADWIKHHIDLPIIIGPDEESAQWVSGIAHEINAPFVIAKKIRHNDQDVTVTLPSFNDHQRKPILVDDIISTGVSMIAITQQLLEQSFQKPICVVVHALCNEASHQNMLNVGIEQIFSCNTVKHFSNQINIGPLILDGIVSS